VAELLLKQGQVANEAEANRAAALSQGSIEAAVRWLEPELFAFRQSFLEYLSTREATPGEFVKTLSSFVDAAGKEAPAKRARLKEASSVAEQFFRLVISANAGAAINTDDDLTAAIQQALRWFPADPEYGARCLELCLAAAQHVEANANQANVIEWWLDELSLAAAGQAAADFSSPLLAPR
jgi:DNA polymerase-3 subunit delta'